MSRIALALAGILLGGCWAFVVLSCIYLFTLTFI